MSGEIVLSWLATYALHSTLLIGAAWLATRRGPLAASTARDAFWKIATTGALLTTTLQIAAPFGDAAIDLRVPGTAFFAPEPAAVPEEGVRTSKTSVEAAEETSETSSTGPATSIASPPPTSITTGDPARRTEVMKGGTGSESPPVREADRQDAAATIRPAQGISIPLPAGPGPVLAIWLALGAALLLRHAVRRRRFTRRLGARRAITGGPAREALDELLRKANAGRRVTLTATEDLASPVALHGNEICVPDRAFDRLDRGELRALLAHELAHLERRDPLWIELAAVLESLLFFQPLHRFARRELRSAAEEQCDAWAARLTGERHALARCLVEVAGWMRSARLAEAAGMAEPGKGLERRVERLIDPAAGIARGSGRAGVLTALGLVVAIACGGPAVRPADGDLAPVEPEAAARPDRANPPSVVATRPPAAPAEGGEDPPEAPEAAPPDTLDRSGPVRQYVFREGDEEPWFVFDWSAWREEMKHLGNTLERSLEPLEDIEFHFDYAFPEGFDLYVDSLGVRFPKGFEFHIDSLGLRSLGAHGEPWEAAILEDALKVRIEGEVEWGEGTISSISPGGRIEIRDRRQAPERNLVVQPGPEGELLFDYEVDGRPHGFDAEGREWLAAVVERIREAEESGHGFKVGPEWARAWDVRARELAERAAEKRTELEERREGNRATALRARLRALEAEIDRLRQEIDRLEAGRTDS